MKPLKIYEIEKAINGKIIRGNPDLVVDNICTDSREVKNGDLFLPLKGEKHDAHKFIAEAVKKGADCVIIDRELKYKCNSALIKVEDTNKALQTFAHYYRNKFKNLTVVAITGSSGKTTTKDMIASILERKYNIIKTEGNLNNYFGLPLTLLQLTGKEDMAVLEMGMSELGEIKLLTEIAEPAIGVVTNVGPTHLEFLKTVKNVARGKSELIAGLTGDGIAVLNYDNKYVREMNRVFTGKKIVFYGLNNKADIWAEDIKIDKNKFTTNFILNYRNEKREIKIYKSGKHNVYNALAAIGVARELKVDWYNIKSGLMSNKYSKMRQEIKQFNDYIIINDTYNANPMSVKAALAVLQEIAGERKIAVLGSMLELGVQEQEVHREIGKYITHSDIDVLITIGELGQQIARGVDIEQNKVITIYETENNEGALKLLLNIIKKGDTLLIKGSRSNKMEEIVEELCKQGG